MFAHSGRQSRRLNHKLSAGSKARLAAAVVEALEGRWLLSVSFASPVTYAIGGHAAGVVRAQLAGDGHQDLVTANYNGTVSVLLGNGDGTFKAAQSFPDGLSSNSGGYSNDFAVVDLGNGHPDIVVASGYSGQVSIMLGNGDGTFKSPTEVTVSNSADVSHLVVGDLGNGKQDLVTGDSDGTVNVLLGNGDGTFQSPQSYYLGGSVHTIALAAVDDGGNTDIVVGDDGNGTAVVLAGNGDGSFSAAQTIGLAGSSVSKVYPANFDGHEDLLVQNKNQASDLLLGNGDGTFKAAIPLPQLGIGYLAADVNGDGNLDLITAASTGRVTVLLGNGDGTFKSPVSQFTINADTTSAALGADLNGDGDADFVVGYGNSSTIKVRLNTTPIAPVFNSANSTTFTTGTPGTFAVTTTGSPGTAITETGKLPTGVTLHNNGTGTATLTGTATVGGAYVFTIAASNAAAKESQVFTLTVDQALNITSANHATVTADKTASPFQVIAKGFPTPTLSDNSATLPTGMSFTPNSNGTATLSGEAAAGTGGVYAITLTASDGGTFSPVNQVFTLTVDEAPTITTTNTATFTTGVAGTFPIAVNGSAFPLPTITKKGTPPAGISFEATGDDSAALLGTPAGGTGGTYHLTLTTSNGISPAGTQVFTLIVLQPPNITTAAAATFQVGKTNSFKIKATGVGSATPTLSDNSATLPAGLSLTDNHNGTATLSGDAQAGTGGTYSFTLTASNGVSPDFNQTFMLTVDEAPKITSAGTTDFSTALNGSFGIVTTGYPRATVTAKGLPSGVSLVSAGHGTMALEGTPAIPQSVSFAAPRTYSFGVSEFAITSADLTGNGIQDIVTADSNSKVSVLLGNGDGTFKPAMTFSDGLSTNYTKHDEEDLTVADLGNGHADILVSDEVGGDVSVLLGNGDGTFQSPQLVNAAVGNVQSLAVADLGNGEPDLVTDDNNGFISVLLGNGDGSFKPVQTIQVSPNYGSAEALVVTDLTGDGIPDIVAIPNTYTTAVLLTGNGDGAFSSPQTITAAGSKVNFVNVADFNGHEDLIIRNTDLSSTVDLNNGLGTFTPVQVSSAGYSGSLTGDFNGDGNIDLVVRNNTSGASTILLGNGNGTFRSAVAGPSFNLNTTSGAVAADLTGDGKSDLVFAYTNGTIGVRLNTSPVAAHTYKIVLTASNGISPAATQSFSLVVLQPATFTSDDSDTFTIGTSNSFTIQTSDIGSVTPTLTETGDALPAGLTFTDNGNGTATLSGDAQSGTAGTYNLTLSAANVVGITTQVFTLAVNQAIA